MPKPFSQLPVGAAIQPCMAGRRTRPSFWIEIELVGENGSPIAWEEYELMLPDGSKVPGFLDDRGYARFDGIVEEGACQLRFPNLDSDAWQALETLGAREVT